MIEQDRFKISAVVRLKHGPLFEWMRDNNYTQKELAKLLNVKQTTVGAWINLRTIPREPILTALCDLTGMSCEELFPSAYVFAVRKKKFSNMQQLYFTKELPLADMLAWSNQEALPSAENIIIDLEEKELLKEAIDHALSEKEKEVIKRRFGFSGYDEHTLNEIGSQLRCSSAFVGQVEVRALRKIRMFLKQKAKSK